MSDLLYNPLPNLELTRFASIKKHSFQIDQKKRIEVDLYARSEDSQDVDLKHIDRVGKSLSCEEIGCEGGLQ